MKTVITGVTSLRNRGEEALVATIIEQLRCRLPSPTFLVLDRAPDYDASRLTQPDTRFRFDETFRRVYVSRIRSTLMGASRFVKRLAREFQEVRGEIRSADLVCAAGGDIFGSDYGHRSLLSHLAPLQAAREFDRPYFFLAHSIGPFKTAADREAFLAVARDAAGISVRERLSYQYLTQDLGLPASLVTHTADPAFLLRCPHPDRLAKLGRYHGCDGARPVIALTPSQAICQWTNSDRDRHFRAWCAVIAMLLREIDAGIIFIPHVQETAPWNDDRVLIAALVRHFDFDPRLQIAGGDYSASEFKGIVSQCDMVVSERMHPCIAGLSSGICTVAIGYSIKAEGILRDLFEPQQVKDGLLLTLDDFLDETTACARIRTAWRMKSAVEAHLKDTLPEVQRRAGLTFDLVAEKVGVTRGGQPLS